MYTVMIHYLKTMERIRVVLTIALEKPLMGCSTIASSQEMLSNPTLHGKTMIKMISILMSYPLSD